MELIKYIVYQAIIGKNEVTHQKRIYALIIFGGNFDNLLHKKDCGYYRLQLELLKIEKQK